MRGVRVEGQQGGGERWEVCGWGGGSGVGTLGIWFLVVV